MGIEEQLRDKLEKVEALYFGAETAGERNVAEAAIERLRARLAEVVGATFSWAVTRDVGGRLDSVLGHWAMVKPRNTVAA